MYGIPLQRVTMLCDRPWSLFEDQRRAEEAVGGYCSRQHWKPPSTGWFW